ncbi:cupin domain-containing protein [Sphingobium sp. B12D2B]|uniref:cupin domain-containing protein n=1 Tax=Sphingobium sp. B12D2B TaxID=2940577 RepID=UPI002224C61A|nr:cupin domain-containing protein [Sphingobium sp. B12D2B]MCW2350613.1 putative cupin superfamily protein [Sphingobium sp. B12D2B]
MTPKSLSIYPIHLARGGKAVAQPAMTSDPAWYAAYDARHGGDGADGRLVSAYRFSSNWSMWERHPLGDEIVYCIAGAVTLRQRGEDGTETHVALSAGDYAINPANVWHTADAAGEVEPLFITPGSGTEHEPR